MKPLTLYLENQTTKPLFIPYIMAGAQGLEHLPEEIEMLAKSGATAIELGIPFSDPVADGPIIQEAGLNAFKHQVTLKKIIAVLQDYHSPVPLILMGYSNSFFHYGVKQLVDDLKDCHVQGVIIPDLPYEHRDLVLPDLGDIALIQLVSLTSPSERIDTLVKEAEGFIYAVTINGTTGVNKTYQQNLTEHLKEINEKSAIPVLAGFGISKAEHVRRFAQCCDGVVVGSKIVHSLQVDGLTKTQELIGELLR